MLETLTTRKDSAGRSLTLTYDRVHTIELTVACKPTITEGPFPQRSRPNVSPQSGPKADTYCNVRSGRLGWVIKHKTWVSRNLSFLMRLAAHPLASHRCLYSGIPVRG